MNYDTTVLIALTPGKRMLVVQATDIEIRTDDDRIDVSYAGDSYAGASAQGEEMTITSGERRELERSSQHERAVEELDARIDAHAAAILADDNELSNAMGGDAAVLAAVCDITRICMDRISWTVEIGKRQLHGVPPPSLLTATAALRAALSEHVASEMAKGDAA